MNKLKHSEIAQVRTDLLAEQQGRCALCGQEIEPGKAVLDHDHRSGQIRGVLHRGCNALEGMITNSLPRNLITPARLAAIFQNWTHYHENPKPMLHPTHKLPGTKTKKRKKPQKKSL
jgi:hypothetical protein